MSRSASLHASPDATATTSSSSSASPERATSGARSIHADRLAGAVHAQLLECMARAIDEDEQLSLVERQLADELHRVRARIAALEHAGANVFGLLSASASSSTPIGSGNKRQLD